MSISLAKKHQCNSRSIVLMYNVNVSPPAFIMFNESTSLKLVLEYNTEYNVSIEAVISCGFSTAGFITLNYSEAY